MHRARSRPYGVLVAALLAAFGPVLWPGASAAQPQRGQSRLWDGLRYPTEGRYHDLVSRAELALSVNGQHSGREGTRNDTLDIAPSSPPEGTRSGVQDGAQPLAARDAKAEAARLRAAEGVAREAIRMIPSRPQGWEVLGRLMQAMDRQGEAADAYAEALRLDSSFRPRTLGYAFAMSSMRAGRYLVASGTLQALVGPEDPPRLAATLLCNAAVALVAAGQLHRARSLFEQAVTKDPAYEPPRWGLAVTAHHAEKPDLARRLARAALLVDPKARFLTSPRALFVPLETRHYYEALASEAQGDPRRALAQWQAYLRAAPRSPWRAQAEAALLRLRPSVGSSGPALAEGMRGAPSVRPRDTPPGRPRGGAPTDHGRGTRGTP